jgi:hypothetical protein
VTKLGILLIVGAMLLAACCPGGDPPDEGRASLSSTLRGSDPILFEIAMPDGRTLPCIALDNAIYGYALDCDWNP